MKAALYNAFRQPIAIETVPDPVPSDTAVVIRVAATGLCLSDWHGWMGHDPDIVLPHVPGHELAGTIVETGTGVKRWTKGQRVTVPFVGGCGHCVYCREGNQQVCNHQFQPGFTAWGSFAEYVAIDYADENLVELPESMDFISAASLGCRFVTAFRAVSDQAGLQAGQWLAVHGCGGVGLSAIQIAKALGARVIAVDITDEKCQLAKTLGADIALNAAKTRVVQEILDYSGGGVHASIDALGHPQTCLNSIHSLRKRGKHLQVGLLDPDQPAPEIPMPKILANELQLIGSHGMQAHRYPALFALIQKGGIQLHQMVSQTLALEAVPTVLPGLHLDPHPGLKVVTSF